MQAGWREAGGAEPVGNPNLIWYVRTRARIQEIGVQELDAGLFVFGWGIGLTRRQTLGCWRGG